MPTFNAKTLSADMVWASPDGQRKIFEVLLDTGSGNAKAKTYSLAIGQVGFEGEVETYEKPGKMGAETFVKQVPKEAGGYSSGGSYTGGSKKPMADPYTMYLSYAKDIAVASIHEGKFDAKLYEDVLAAVEAGGAQLYSGRPDAPQKAPETAVDTIHPVPDGGIDLSALNNIFPE